jgi:RHS repeat-associated protein
MENRSYTNGRISFSKTYEFTGKERDDESNYDYFGARYYDARIGRWGGVEPLLDKYASWSPYNYGLCNPTALNDVDGKDVRATTSGSQQMILNTLPKEVRSSVVFNNEGYIDKAAINSVDKAGGNFESLRQLVNSDIVFNVAVQNGFTYSDENGNLAFKEFGPITIDNEGGTSLSTNETGFLGVTLTPGNEKDKWNSTDGNVNIIINEALSTEGQAQIFSHEGYGHGFLYSIGESYTHDYTFDVNGEFLIEGNKKLSDQINNSTKETIKNMESK